MAGADRDHSRPKYALAEWERRWLVAHDHAAALAHGSASLAHGGACLAPGGVTVICDLYVAGSRLRLRRMETPDGHAVFKLCKKYGDRAAGAESITNLYLSAPEYTLLAALPGWRVTKRRHRLSDGSLDHYQRGHDRVWVFEREFPDMDCARLFEPPAFAGREITDDAAFTGAALAQRFGEAVTTTAGAP